MESSLMLDENSGSCMPRESAPRSPAIDGHDCGIINTGSNLFQVTMRRRRGPHDYVLDGDSSAGVDNYGIDMATARGDDAVLPAEERSKGRSSGKQHRPFPNGGARTMVALPFLLICAIVLQISVVSAATSSFTTATEGAGVPTLDERFERRQVPKVTTTSTARAANLRRPSSSSSTTIAEAVSSEEVSSGRMLADFFTENRHSSDPKPKPLEFRIENVNRIRPSQEATSVTNQHHLPPFSPLEHKASIVFQQPVIGQPAPTTQQQQMQSQPHGGSHWHTAANFGPPVQFTSVGGMIPAAKLTFNSPSISSSATSTSANVPSSAGSASTWSAQTESSTSTSTSTPLGNTYQAAEEDYKNFYKQTQEEKDETAKAREGLLAKLYGNSDQEPSSGTAATAIATGKPNHSGDIGGSFGIESPVINRGPATTRTGAPPPPPPPPPLQGRGNHYRFTLVGNTINVIFPGQSDPIETDFTVDPSQNYCVVQSGCTVFYDTSTNTFVDGNGATVGVDIDIDTIISENASGGNSGNSSNNNAGYTLFLKGNTIYVRYRGQEYETQFTVDSNNCVVQVGDCSVKWDGNGGFVNQSGSAVSVEIDLETIISQGNAGSGSGSTTEETTIVTTTEETNEGTNTGGGNNNGGNNNDGGDGDDDDDDDDGEAADEASGPTMEPTIEASDEGPDSADKDSAEHSGGKGKGKGYSRSSSGKGKGKGSSSKSSKGSKSCKKGKSGKSGKSSKSSKSCSSSSGKGKGKGKGGYSPSSPSRSHPPPPSPPSGGSRPPPPSPSSPSKPSSPSRPTRPPVARPTKPSRPTTPSRPTRAPRPSRTPKPTRRPRRRPTPRPTPVEGPTISPMPTKSEEPTPAPAIRTPKPSFGPTDERCNGITDATRAILIRYEVIPISGLVALTDTESPQWQAYEWLVYDDDRFICPNDDTLTQRYILAVLYFATAGDAWDKCYRDDNECREEEDADPYLSASSECEWYGSECYADGSIESVTLENNNLMNEMPLEITQIARLLDLNLANNVLEGTLPKILGDLADLRSFNVEKNSIEGELPDSMFELERLEVLNLNGNGFSGTINEKVGDLRRLKEAHFGDNGFEGEIPSAFGQLSDLELLRLQDNDLEGEMPEEVCELRDEKLDELWSDCGTPPDPPQVECQQDVCCTECFP